MLKRNLIEGKMPGEDEGPTEGKDSPMVEAGLLAAMRRLAIRKHQE